MTTLKINMVTTQDYYSLMYKIKTENAYEDSSSD